MFRSETPYHKCASAIGVCADVGANRHGDESVVCPAGDDPHQKKNGLHCGSWNDVLVVDAAVKGARHRQVNVSDAAWKLYRENSACSLRQGSCSSISKYAASVDGFSPHPLKGWESGVCVAWMNLPRHVSTAGKSGSHGSVLRPSHRHIAVAS